MANGAAKENRREVFCCGWLISIHVKSPERTAFGAFMEAPPRFELGNQGFADPCLTTWLWRHRKAKDVKAIDVFCDGAAYEARTRYLHLGKVALYQMS